MQSHEYQDFHKGKDKKAHLGRQYCDSPGISFLKHCKTSLAISLLLFHGLITPCFISPSYPALISTPPSPRHMFPIYNHCQKSNFVRSSLSIHLFRNMHTTKQKIVWFFCVVFVVVVVIWLGFGFFFFWEEGWFWFFVFLFSLKAFFASSPACTRV